MGGPRIETQADIEQGTWALRLGQPFVEWVDQAGGATYDDLLIWVKDAVAGEYGMRLQPRESRQEEEIEQRNRQLVQIAEEIVAHDRKSRSAIPAWELAAILIGRGLYAHSTPPDDMHYVLHEYSRLRLYDDMGYTFQDRIPTLKNGQRQAGSTQSRMGGSVDVSELPPWLQGEWQSPFWADRDLAEGEDLFEMNEVEDNEEMLFWDKEANSLSHQEDDASDYCEGYQSYLAEFSTLSPEQPALSHIEFHLLEAELEMLIGLEQEFGYLMPEQEDRKISLAERLFIDLNYFYDDSDWDQSDYDEPPYWQN